MSRARRASGTPGRGLPSALDRLAEQWRRDAELFRQHGHEAGARTCALHAEELESAVREHLMEALTVAQASELSGYSESHLRFLLSQRKLENVGQKGAPRIRRVDLPSKPGEASAAHLSLAEEALAERTVGSPSDR